MSSRRSTPLRRTAARAVVAAILSASATAAVPGVADAVQRSVTVRVYGADGTTLHHEFTAAVDTADFGRFAVATVGENDPGSGEGQIAVDDLVVTDLNDVESTWTFATAPTITESATGNTNDAMRYDAAGQRVLAIGNSGYACSTNYESIDLSTSVKRARFTIRRLTGDVGDGSFWHVHMGLVPSNSEPIVGASCTGYTGHVDNFAGVEFSGDGDNVRHKLAGIADGTLAPAQFTASPGTTYVVEVETTAPQNAPPNAPQHVSPYANQVFRVAQAQTFTIRATDPEGNRYTGEITVRDAATNTVVRTFQTAKVISGTYASGSPSPALPSGSYKWSAVAFDDFGGTSAASAPAPFRVNVPPAVATQVSPAADKAFSADEAQSFAVVVTDPDGDNVRAAVTVRNAVTGAVVQTFTTALGASGSTVSAQPPSPLPTGTYTWSAQSFDSHGDSASATGTRPFSVLLASEECTTGTTVTDGYVNGTYVRLRLTKVGANTYWVCWRVDNGSSVRNGGRFVVDGADVSGTPTVDSSSEACAAPGNLLPPSTVIRGTVGDPADPAYLAYAADGYLSTGKASICLSVADTGGAYAKHRVQIPVPQADTPEARLVPDAVGTYRPAPVDQPSYPSGDCQTPATGTATEVVNAAVTTGTVWLATWQESAHRAHICVRSAGGVNRGGRLTIDTGASGFSPNVGTGSDTTACDRGVAAVTSGPAPFEIERSAGASPAYVCVTVGTTKVAVRVGVTGSLLPPTVVWTPDSAVL